MDVGQSEDGKVLLKSEKADYECLSVHYRNVACHCKEEHPPPSLSLIIDSFQTWINQSGLCLATRIETLWLLEI